MSIALLLTIPGCYREVSDDTFSQLPVSGGPWAADGLVLGITMEECEAALGLPDRVLEGRGDGTLWQWSRLRRTTVTFNKDELAVEISGATLTDRHGHVMIWKSASEDEVRHILSSARIRKNYRPKGSGVISLGREHVGTTFTVNDELGTYTVTFYEGRISHVLARAPSVVR